MGGVAVHTHHVAWLSLGVEIDAACAAAGGLFRTNYLPGGIGLLTLVDTVLVDIVEAYDIESLNHFTSTSIGDGGVARGIEQTSVLPHGLCHTTALDCILHTPLLIAVAPEDD